MRKLHVVGVSEDGGTLVLADAPDAPGAYTAPVEDRLRAALRRPVRRTTGAGRGSLTPREIQARLRAGAELADVAAEAGLPPERLEAYAAPVLSERARVLEDARAARMSRPQLGPSAVPLAVAVGQRLRALLGGQPEAVRWSASRAEDASWTVQFSYAADGATGTAAWRWDRSAHSLTPLNRAAAELGHVPRHAERPVPDPAPVGRGSGVAPAGDAAARSADDAATRVADGADAPAAPAAPATRRSGVPAPVAAVLAALRAPDPQAGIAADTGPVAASATPPPGDRSEGRATTGPHRADGTQGPSRVEDLQVDAAQAPTVAVLSPPAQPAASEPAPAATAPAAARAPAAAQAPAAAEPPAARELVAEGPALARVEAPAPAVIAAPAVTAAPAAAPAPAATAAAIPGEGPQPEHAPAPTPQPAQPREPVKPRGRTARRAAVPTWADVLLGTTPSDQREAQSPDPGAATG